MKVTTFVCFENVSVEFFFKGDENDADTLRFDFEVHFLPVRDKFGVRVEGS